jgi:amino acid adenylation domain-containing protein
MEFNPFAGPQIEVAVPSTEPQREIWNAAQLGTEASLAYNESISLEMRGPLDVDALRASLGDLVRRHESLRSTFTADGLSMCVFEDAPAPMEILDLTGQDGDTQEASRRSVLAREVETPFDLEKGPLARIVLLRMSSDRHEVVFTAHHIVVDGWSWAVLLSDWAALYRGRRSDASIALPPADRFSVYAQERSQARRSPEALAAEAYWLKQFEGAIPALDLPTDRARSAHRSFASRRLDVVLPTDLVREVKKTGARSGASLFVTFLAAFKALLFRLSGQRNVVVGVPAAGQMSGHQALVGHCVNTLPLRVNIDPQQPFRDLLAAVRTAVLEGFDHQYLTYGEILRSLPVPRDPSRPPLVSLVFNIDKPIDPRTIAFDGLATTLRSNPRHFESFDLFVNGLETAEGLALECQYNRSLFDESSVRRILGAFEALIRSAVRDPDCPVGRLQIRTDEEHVLLASWNATGVELPAGMTTHDLIAAQALRAPEAVAIEQGGRRVTYADLMAEADALAARLQSAGVGPGTLVGLCTERTPAMVAGLLGVLKAGGAYVPLDPAYPSERLALMVEDSGMSVVVTSRGLRERVPLGGAKVILLDEEGPAPGVATETRSASSDDIAYVIYTSGSTGRPKGVQIPHRALVNFLLGMAQTPGLNVTDRIVAVTTLSFDIAGLELLLPLTVGATILLADRETAMDGERLKTLLESSQATVMQATPATWRLLMAAGWRGGSHFKILCGGEAMSRDLAESLLERAGSVWNMYGPTETTIWSTCWRVERPTEGVFIGRPIANTQVHVLDELMQPCPIGVPGELWIGGEGVAAGYLNRPELTAERFVTDPFTDRVDARIYRTGDLARWRASGNLECLGRTDFQVKVRGFRIELGEIEAVLSSHPSVAHAVVVAREDRPGDVRLVAYGVPSEGGPWDEGKLRAHLAKALPEYMVPQHFVPLETLPLTPSGKVDRKALPAPADRPARGGADYLAPRTELEQAVASAFQSVLGVPRIDVRDDFFQLGGHSLLAAQVVAHLAKHYSISLSMRSVFEAPTVEKLAVVVATQDGARVASGTPTQPIPRRPDQTEAPATPMQQRVWYLEQTQPGMTAFNVPSSFRLRGPLNVPALERALNEIIARHATLRTNFEWRDGGLIQKVGPTASVSLADIVDLTSIAPSDQEAALFALLRERMRQPFELTKDVLVRMTLVRLGPEHHVLSLIAHHIIWDGWSFDIYRHELNSLYAAFCAGRLPALPHPTVSYGDFAEWQRDRLSGPELQRQLTFWRKQLAGDLPPLDLPTDRPRPAIRSDRGDGVRLQFTRRQTEEIAAAARRYDATPFMFLLAAFQALLYRYTGHRDVRIGIASRGRTHPDTENVIGFFVNTLVMRAVVNPEASFGSLLRQVRGATLDAFSHEEMPFEILVRELNAPRDPSRTPLVQHLFSYQDARARSSKIGDLELSLVPVQAPSAQTDLTLWFVETRDGLTGALNYSTDLFDGSTMERMVAHYKRLVTSIISDPEAVVGRLALLPEAESGTLCEAWNATGVVDRPDACIHDLFSEQAVARPDAIAAVWRESEMTYGELEARSNQFARYLRRMGVGSDVPVGLCMERSLDVLVSLLGILKAGGAYLSLEPTFPQRRLAFMLEDAKVPVIVTTAKFATSFPGFEGRLVLLDREAEAIARETTIAPQCSVSALHLAYVTYTSGSTGVPKGVEIPHRAVNRLVRGADYVTLGPDVAVLHAATLAFDASTFEIWGPLLNGGRCILHAEAVPTPNGLAKTIKAHGVTTAFLTTALFNAVVNEDPAHLRGIRELLVGGEALSVPHVCRAQEALPDTEILNVYGPTECTTFTTAYSIPRPFEPSSRSVPIGRPILDTRTYVLDGQSQLTPTGVIGELYVGGAGLARGYLRRPELTAEKFVRVSHVKGGDRLYRTGDLVRHLNDGTIEFVGRRDAQVKVRGFRIELGEIEARLAEHPSVAQATVITREDRPGDVRLAAYVVPERNADFTGTELRDFLRESLPDYMIPAFFVEMESLPLTETGKVDRRALPAPGVRRTDDDLFVAPRDERERLVAELWAESLDVPQVGVHDNFFELGGHSLLCLEVVAKLERRCGVRLNPREMLFGTLEAVASRLPRPTRA